MLRIDPVRPDFATLDRARELLLRGKVVVAPTETRYGLLTRADEQRFVDQLYRLKGRDQTKATAILVRNLAEAEDLGELSPQAKLLARHFLPGPLTLVVRARKDWSAPRVVEGKIGLRWSSSPVIQGLLDRTEWPLTATSANVSGQADAEVVEEIVSIFGNRVGAYLDAGPLTGRTSTVVDCSTQRAQLLREGVIAREEIERVLGIVNE
ncbi:MAG: L-threonylcarbamoyladenylate synthase [Candidatus Zixiibacteriota bacterium]